METSTTIKEISEALLKFQKEVGAVKKDAVNPFFKSTYATLQNVIDTVREPMVKNGLSFAQIPDGDGLCTILMHTSGEYIKATGKMTPKDETPQGQGSAITYMRRYALSSVLGIATEDDDDGNSAQPKQPRTEVSAPKVKKTDFDLAMEKVENTKWTEKSKKEAITKIEKSGLYDNDEKFELVDAIKSK